MQALGGVVSRARCNVRLDGGGGSRGRPLVHCASAGPSQATVVTWPTSARPAGRRLSAPESPFEVIENDLLYIQDRTGLDLLTPLGPVKDVHDQVVAVLNPIAGGRMEQELEQQVAGLRADLAVAKQEVNASEQRLQETIDRLGSLEAAVLGLEPGSASHSVAITADEVHAGAHVTDEASTSASRPSVHSVRPAQQRGRQRANGLHSDMNLPEQLREFWYPAEFSSRLAEGQMVQLELFGEEWVLFRDASGRASCIRDQCAHRACPLSLGTVVEGCVQCPYHGWEFDGEGACTKMPSTPFNKDVRVRALPVEEADGFVWVWPGCSAPTGGVPAITRPPSGFSVHAELSLEVPVEHGLLLENLLDLAHAPFTHTSTFAKGWPVPEVVRFNAQRLLGGNWEPYPIDMSFEPPCMVVSTIGLAKPGKIERGATAAMCRNHLHQLHVCLPAGPRRTRLLYRMSMDFIQWTKWVPGIKAFWRYIANQVLGEDLVLVTGQQDRMLRGGDVWANPVSYDKLGVRYRRWRNSVAGGDSKEREAVEKEMRPMSAGEIFSADIADDGL